MTFNRAKCPECFSDEHTTVEADIHHPDEYIEVWVCTDCHVQYDVHYGSPYKEVTHD